jgi:hypothetical protein
VGCGGWGFGVVGLGPMPHSPIPNPQSPIPNEIIIIDKINKKFFNILNKYLK